MDNDDWNRFEELVYQAGGVANTTQEIPHEIRADAMSFHTLGLAILDLQKNKLAGDNLSSGKPLVIATPY